MPLEWTNWSGNYIKALTELRNEVASRIGDKGHADAGAVYMLLDHLEGGRMMFAPGSNLEDTSVETPTGKPVFLYEFERGGVRRLALITIAYAAVEFKIPRLAERSFLCFYVAKAFEIGDEAVARIYLVREGNKELMYERSIDPANRVQDRRWHYEQIDLSRYAGESGSLLFQCHPGRRSDEAADWIGWSKLRIVYEK